VSETISKLITDTGKPEPRSRCLPQHYRIVFENWNPHAAERRSNAGKVMPPVMITQDRPGSERRRDSCQFRGPDEGGAVGDDGGVLDLGVARVQGLGIVDVMLGRAEVLKVRNDARACGVSVQGIVEGDRVVALAGKHPGREGLGIETTLTQRLGPDGFHFTVMLDGPP